MIWIIFWKSSGSIDIGLFPNIRRVLIELDYLPKYLDNTACRGLSLENFPDIHVIYLNNILLE